MIAVEAIVRLVFAGSIDLFGPIGGLAGVPTELSIVIATLSTFCLTPRLERYNDDRARRRVLEEGFVKWSSEVAAQQTIKRLWPVQA